MPRGRPKGSKNKFTQTAKEAFEYAFEQAGGQEHLAEWVKSDPKNFGDFLKLYAKLLPRTLEGELTHTHRTLRDLTDDELLALLGRGSGGSRVATEANGADEPSKPH